MDSNTKELIEKLETISALYKDVLAINQKKNSFVPKDEYERSIAVPDFPEVEEGEKDKSILMKAVEHKGESAEHLMGAAHKELYAPKEPVKPEKKKFIAKTDAKAKDKENRLGCLSFLAIGISIFFFLAGLINLGQLNSEIGWTIPVIFAISFMSAGAFVAFKIASYLAKKKRQISEELKRKEFNSEQNAIEEAYKEKLIDHERLMAIYNQKQEAFLTEYSAWRKIYLAHLEEEAKINDLLEKDRQAEIARINKDELAPALEKLNEINDIITDEYLPSIDKIISLIKSGRASNLKESLNLYEDILYRERQLQLEKEREEQRRYEEMLRREDERQRHEDEMRFREAQEYHRQKEEERRREDAERHHREEMKLREHQERNRLNEQSRFGASPQHSDSGQRSLSRQCNTCAHNGHCSMAYSRPNCASYRPR